MIPSGALLAVLLAAAAPDPAAQGESGEAGAKEAGAKETPPPPPVDEQALEPFRIPVEAIAERMVGSASRAVRFDWRKKKVGVAAVASDLVELNNFSSLKLGVSARVPLGGFMVEGGLSWVGTWGSRSTELLALTPYRQVARPSRFQLDANLAYPLAEGVATSRPGFLPATELVFSAVAGLRYLYYPGSLHGLTLRESALALVAPLLGQAEVDNLEAARLPAMEIDRARYGALGGVTLDVYFPPGAFITPRVMISPPLLSLGSGLGWWWELTFSAGWMF